MSLQEAVVALDIGSTRFKAGVWRGAGGFDPLESTPAPALRGEGEIRECDPEALVGAATELLHKAARGLPRPVPLGLTAQRSSFLVWEASSGRPVTPMVSWQDRRAADWCERHARLGPEIERRTGLRLSPHYFAPKLACLCEADPALARGLREGRLRAGTLDSYLLSAWSGGRVFVTDPTIAARTLLVDLERPGWSPALLDLFGLPLRALADIGPSMGHAVRVGDEFLLRALVSDQASGVLAALGDQTDAALINLGTGGFVLRPVGTQPVRRSGYLCGPYLSLPDRTLYALEGTINGIGPAVDAHGAEPTPWPVQDTMDDAFCLPDSSGVGSPYWLPRQGLRFSPSAEKLALADRRRVVLEGVAFRVRQIADDLLADGGVSTIYLSGGLTREPLLRFGLATLFDGDVRLLKERESALTGVACLAAGQMGPGIPDSSPIPAEPAAGYMNGKYDAWREWMNSFLMNDPGGSGP